jgi:hypothetical protein
MWCAAYQESATSINHEKPSQKFSMMPASLRVKPCAPWSQAQPQHRNAMQRNDNHDPVSGPKPEATLQVHQSLEGAPVVELQLSGPDSMVALTAYVDVRRQFVPKKHVDMLS